MKAIEAIDRKQFGVSRRLFLVSAGALAIAPTACAQTTGIRLRKLHQFEIRVSDVAASVQFYQDLFGMPIQSQTAGRTCLRIGEGPQFMAIRQIQGNEVPAITHLGYSIDDYDIERVLDVLQARGFDRIEAPPLSAAGIDFNMKAWVRTRGDTQELYFSDERGLIVQLSNSAYCGGTGASGDSCPRPESVPDGLMRLNDLNHFTVFLNGGDEANRFYQDTFGLSVQAYQGPQGPVTGIGDGFQFVMYAGPRRDEISPANIHHACFNMNDFDVERILLTLTNYGLAARGDSPIGPLMHYVSLRMPARGGAEGGTPELYFTDPDGILMQLQDISYCGGGGYLGDECLSA